MALLLKGAQDKSIVVASTTSTQDSGLFEYLPPIFKQKMATLRKVADRTRKHVSIEKLEPAHRARRPLLAGRKGPIHHATRLPSGEEAFLRECLRPQCGREHINPLRTYWINATGDACEHIIQGCQQSDSLRHRSHCKRSLGVGYP